VDKQDKTLKHGTQDSEDRSNEFSYFKFLGIDPEVGPSWETSQTTKKNKVE
jgi:hypothetical protein